MADGGILPTRVAPFIPGYGDNTISWDMSLPAGYSADSGDYAVTVTVTGIRMPNKTTRKYAWTTTLVRAAP